MTVEEIRELINLVVESGIAELEVQRGDDRVRVKRTSGSVNQEIVMPAAVPAPVMSSAPASAFAPPAVPLSATQQSTATAVAPALARNASEAPVTDPDVVLVKSPIVGTYYDAPSPGATPFVKVGDMVQPGSVLCIIESMKLMNEIEAELAGVVVGKLVSNGRPVEYGEALFTVKPV